MPISQDPPLPRAELQSPADEARLRRPAIPLLKSGDLFTRSREILIEHSGGLYRLRLTNSNKLILTK
jgi:hemin uptake protein HemP